MRVCRRKECIKAVGETWGVLQVAIVKRNIILSGGIGMPGNDLLRDQD